MTGEDRWRLLDEKEFLTRSLADAEDEHAAGDLSAADFEALQRRDRARLEMVEERLATLTATMERLAAGVVTLAPGSRDDAAGQAPADDGAAAPPAPDDRAGAEGDQAPRPAPRGRATSQPGGTGRGASQRAATRRAASRRAATPPEAPRRRRRNRALAVVGTAAILAGVILLVFDLAHPRLPGQPLTGSVTLNSAKQVDEQLAQAADLVNQGTTRSVEEALALYRKVLSEDPHQPQALAETGWLEWQSARARNDRSLEAAGQALVERSLSVQSDDYAAHLYLGTMELEGGNPKAAAAEYSQFLAERPPSSTVATAAALIRQAFTEAGQPVPSQVAGS